MQNHDGKVAHPHAAKTKASKLRQMLPWALLIAILAYALIYSIKFVGGSSFFGDDIVYAQLASTILMGHFTENSFIFSVRLLQVYPIAFFFKVFGYSMLSSSAWDITSFLGMILASFLIARELYDDYAGLIAALLMSFFPLAVQLSATISDDIPMAFVSALVILALVVARKRKSRMFYFLAGTFIVMSPIITPEGFIILIVAAAYLLIEILRRKLRIMETIPYVILGMLAAGIVLMGFNYLLSGNPLVTLTVNGHFYSAVGGFNTIPSTNTDLMFYFTQMFPYNLVSTIGNAIAHLNLNPINVWNQIYTINYNAVGFYFYALVFAGIYLVFRKEKRAYIPLLWFLVGFLYLELGPMSVGLHPLHYLLSYRLERFLTFIAVPTVVIIAIAAARFAETKLSNKRHLLRKLARPAFVALIIIFLITTAIPVNLLWYRVLYSERYDQIAIAQYLSPLSNSTKVYFSSAFSNIPLYMRFNNVSRMFVYDEMTNCHEIPGNSYIIVSKSEQQYGLNYTPDPSKYCPAWTLVFSPQLNRSYPTYITSVATPFMANLYYNPPGSPSSAPTNITNTTSTVGAANNTNASSVQQAQAPAPAYNFYNLTGVGVYNRTTNSITTFETVNNVSAVTINLSRSSASAGEFVSVNVLFIGQFDWSNGANSTKAYLSDPLINVHYFGVELANQTGHLLDQNNGPWYNYITTGQPSQHLFGPANKNLLINWTISPTNYSVGKTLKFCAGYFATYTNTTVLGGWAPAFNILSSNQTRVVNSTDINIPSLSCSTLQVT